MKLNPKKQVAAASEVASQKDPKTGRFLPGNSGFGGRPKGARSKLTTEFFADFYAAWQEHGASALKEVAEKSPRDFVRAAAMLMPKEFEIKTPLDDMTDAELADLIAAVQSLIAGGIATRACRRRANGVEAAIGFSAIDLTQSRLHSTLQVHLHRERLLMAGNQLGKTYSGAAEAAIHLTGKYPDWWEGRRWDRPVRAWAGSETGEVTRDGVQRLLIGEPKDETQWGTGLIPGDDLVEWKRKQGVPDALDGALIKHVSGGNSMLAFKTYDQGRTKWQGETLDFVWFDEEPPQDVYIEGLTRTNATGGMVYLTFTPLKGISDVVHSFIQECGQA